ncbi:MAG: glycosyltransferase family 1 protein [Phycisphaeraceae bacterium]|nr:glycosyltransferase family 1 protein [Phycisphaeraceae bacterium]
MKRPVLDSSEARVLYQRFGAGGAFDCIDAGFLAGYRGIAGAVHAWTDGPGEPTLRELLDSFEPTHVVACLHNPDRTLCRWTGDGSLDALGRSGAHVSVRANPPDIGAFFNGCGIDFTAYPEFGVSSFYNRPAGLTDDERRVLGSGAIDLVRSPLAAGAIGDCFRSALELGLPVLEEPHAADVRRYPHTRRAERPGFAASFVGRCWPFKWSHMGPFVEALRDHFGDRFAVFGSGWPEGISNGPIDDSGFAELVANSSVCLNFHEPTQVMPAPFAQNERTFKLLAMGACVVSDANPLLEQQFEIDLELLLAESPRAMVDLIAELEQNPERVSAIAAEGRTRVLGEHTYAHRATRLLAVAADPPGRGEIVTWRGERVRSGVNV